LIGGKTINTGNGKSARTRWKCSLCITRQSVSRYSREVPSLTAQTLTQ
jgi:hypothetical protein